MILLPKYDINLVKPYSGYQVRKTSYTDALNDSTNQKLASHLLSFQPFSTPSGKFNVVRVCKTYHMHFYFGVLTCRIMDGLTNFDYYFPILRPSPMMYTHLICQVNVKQIFSFGLEKVQSTRYVNFINVNFMDYYFQELVITVQFHL